ncbi:MAG TPA: phosphatase PAP2 family protein [Longimicrobiaceae bacterium]|jgi:undecaprenyl-diphosphatase
MSKGMAYTGPERRIHPRHGRLEVLRGILFGLFRWIGGRVRGFHAAVGAFLAIGLVVAVGAVAGFAAVAEEVMEGETRAFDVAVLRWMERQHTPQFDVWALEVTSLGSGLVVAMTVAISSVFLWVTRHRYSVALLWVALLGSGLITRTLKTVFDRPRPDVFPWQAHYVDHGSFPSGHATTSMVVYLTLAYLVGRLADTRRLRALTLLVAAVLIALIGLSRLYLGVHYPSDVIAGYAVGFAWATFCALGIEAVRYFRGRRPGMEQVEEDLEGGLEGPASAG